MSTQIAVQDQAVKTLRDLFARSQDQIARALPRHLTPERMIRMAITTCQRNPKLLECQPKSVVACVVQASELGLELSGPLGQAYLVPRYNKHIKGQEATFQIGYRGFLALAHRSGQVRSFSCHTVRQGDSFRYQLGTDPYITHIPADKDRGEAIYFYSILKTNSGGEDFEVMSRDDVDKHRARYSPKSIGDPYSPWETAYEEMAMKTTIRKLAKRAPVSTEFQKGSLVDEYQEQGINILPTIDSDTPAIENGRPTRTQQLAAALGVAESQSTTVAHVAGDAPGVPAEGQGDPEPGSGQMFPDEPAKDEDLERTDWIHRIEEQITSAKTAKEKRDIGAMLVASRDELGEEDFQRLVDMLNPRGAKR